MSANYSRTTERTEFEGETDRDRPTRAGRAVDAARRRARDGTLAVLAGGALLARALRAKTRRRTVAHALAGVALVGLGLRQRLSGGGRPDREQTMEPGSDRGTAPTAEGDGDDGPGGVSGEPGPEADEEEEGRVAFTEEADEPRPKPGLDEPAPDDPRRNEGEDATVDVSDSATAAEPSEATGPDPEQAEPARTEDTEPEASPPEESDEESTADGDRSETDRDEEPSGG